MTAGSSLSRARQHAARRAAADDDVVELPSSLAACAHRPTAFLDPSSNTSSSRTRLPRSSSSRSRLMPAALVVDALAAQPAFGVEASAGCPWPARLRPPARALPGCPRRPCGRCRGSRSRGAACGRRRRCTRSRVFGWPFRYQRRLETAARRRARSAASGARAPACRFRGTPGRGPSRRRGRSPGIVDPLLLAPLGAVGGERCARRRRVGAASLSSRTAPLSQSVSLLRRSPRS